MHLRKATLALAALAAALGGLALQPPPGNAEPTALEISARALDGFRIRSSKTRFGALQFVGGLELSSSSGDFGGISSFRFLSPGDRFLAVTDTGYWLSGTLIRNAEGRPKGIGAAALTPILNAEGAASGEKWTADAESIALEGDRAVVGFERVHRIAEFAIDPDDMGPAIGERNFLVPARELRVNRGFETLAFAPADSAFKGALVAITERSIDREGNIFAAILDGPLKGIFTVARRDDFDVTDGAFLPDGDLLLLERRFSITSGVAMRLRRIPAGAIRPGSIADGPVLLEADMGYQIDNMEALDVWRSADGATMVSMLSDDNHSILQRNLYLEFRLLDE